MATQNEYFYFTFLGLIPEGPFTWEQFVELAKNGTITANTNCTVNDDPSRPAHIFFGNQWNEITRDCARSENAGCGGVLLNITVLSIVIAANAGFDWLVIRIFLIGAPIVILAACFLGYRKSKSSDTSEPISQSPNGGELGGYATAFFEVLGHAAKSDGKVVKSEVIVVEQLIHAFELNPSQRKAAIDSFNNGKSQHDLNALVRNLARETKSDGDIKQFTMNAVIELTAADGILTHQEEKVLRHLHESLMPIEIVIEDVISNLRDISPYSVLGLTPPVDLVAVKKAYRAKCVEFHPDHLDQNLPPELKAFAAKRMAKIQNAYEQLSAEFG